MFLYLLDYPFIFITIIQTVKCKFVENWIIIKPRREPTIGLYIINLADVNKNEGEREREKKMRATLV